MKVLVLTILLGNGALIQEEVRDYEHCNQRSDELTMHFEIPIMEGNDIIGYEFNGTIGAWKGNLYRVVYISCLYQREKYGRFNRKD